MPIILIIVGVIAALVVGFIYTQNQSGTSIEVDAPSIRVEETTPARATSIVTNPEPEPQPEPTETREPVTSPAPTPSAVTTNPTPTTPTAVAAKTAYKNGTYTVTTTYVAPSRTTHEVTATVQILNDVITEAKINYGGEAHQTSSQYQSRFSQSYQSEVVGKKLDSISLTRVGGASLTTGAYNQALTQVKTQARS